MAPTQGRRDYKQEPDSKGDKLMLTLQQQLAGLEQTALSKINAVDLKTPMQQVGQVLEALLDVPTTARGAHTVFSNQALAALQTLLAETHRLSMAVATMTQHVGRAASPSYAGAATLPIPPRALGSL
jgi:hypothetical protein